MVSEEKSTVNVIVLCYVMSHFSLAVFKICCLVFVFNSLTVMELSMYHLNFSYEIS